MSRSNMFALLASISVLHTFAQTTLNSSKTTTSPSMTSGTRSPSCTYCQTKVCRCSTMESTLNCSSYLLNLTFTSTCAHHHIWDTVDFSARNFESFDGSQLLSLRMSWLSLKANSISHIHDHTFDAIGDVLLDLDLQMNQLSFLSSKWLSSRLTRLQRLNLALNQLQTLDDLDHVRLPALRELNLSCNQIEAFPRQLQQWSALVKLDLSFNKLSSVPRLALVGLQNLTWLSLASNRNLSCLVQDSFKYLRLLAHLDLSSTNLFNLDGCIFTQLISLQTLKIERVPMNCSSCWLSVARKNVLKLSGQCIDNSTVQPLGSLTDQQVHSSCSGSSIDCSTDYCEPGSITLDAKTYSSLKLLTSGKSAQESKNRTIEIVLGVIFSIIALLIILFLVFLIYRWKQGKPLLCCDFLPRSISAARRRHSRQQQQRQIIGNNPTVIESVVTHGADMDVPSYPQVDHVLSQETNANNKRKLYNPLYAETPPSDIRVSQSSTMVFNEGRSHKSQLYSDNL